MKTARELQKEPRRSKTKDARTGDAQLGRHLAELREGFGLTQHEVAAALPDVGRTMLANIELGWAMPSLKALVILAAFYEVSLDDLTAHMRPALATQEPTP